MFRSAFPIVSTTDMSRALAFYRDTLGGNVTYQFPAEGDPGYVALELGSSHLGIGLEPAPGAVSEPRPMALWVYADDCDSAVELVRAAGAVVVAEPEDQPWGERVARVRDPDGNEIVIGSPPPT